MVFIVPIHICGNQSEDLNQQPFRLPSRLHTFQANLSSLCYVNITYFKIQILLNDFQNINILGHIGHSDKLCIPQTVFSELIWLFTYEARKTNYALSM